jgi:hypothetical protein
MKLKSLEKLLLGALAVVVLLAMLPALIDAASAALDELIHAMQQIGPKAALLAAFVAGFAHFSPWHRSKAMEYLMGVAIGVVIIGLAPVLVPWVDIHLVSKMAAYMQSH